MKENASERRLDRRDFLKLIGLTAGLAYLDWYFRGYSLDSNQETELEFLAPGEIVGEQELVDLYLSAALNKQPVETNPVIIRSTVYNAMRFYGMSEKVAKERSNTILLTESGEKDQFCPQVSLACVITTEDNFFLEINKSRFLENNLTWQWVLQALGHEAYHLSVDSINNMDYKEDYGVLGTYTGTRRRGFVGDDKFEGNIDLIKREVPMVTHFLAEEFSAESGSYRYMQHLVSNQGLPDDPETYIGGYSYMVQGIVDSLDTEGIDGYPSWQEWWGAALSPARMDELHKKSSRYEFFSGLGKQILELNAYARLEDLTIEDVAALGLIAFTDFVDFPLSERQVLTSLVSLPLNKSMLRNAGNILESRIQEVYGGQLGNLESNLLPAKTGPMLA